MGVRKETQEQRENSEADWADGFVVNMGMANAMKVELRALWTRLTEARRLGFSEVQIESDSMAVVKYQIQPASARVQENFGRGARFQSAGYVEGSKYVCRLAGQLGPGKRHTRNSADKAFE